jgi:hypothetical protein
MVERRLTPGGSGSSSRAALERLPAWGAVLISSMTVCAPPHHSKFIFYRPSYATDRFSSILGFRRVQTRWGLRCSAALEVGESLGMLSVDVRARPF